MRLHRRTIGAIIGGAGALLATGSAYLSWYGEDTPDEMSFTHLFRTGAADDASTYWSSMAAPLAVLGALGALGALIRSRVLLGFAWMIGATTLVLWGLMRMIGRATGRAPVSADVRFGVWVCLAGMLAIIVGIAIMGRRREEIEAPLSVFDGDPPQ